MLPDGLLIFGLGIQEPVPVLTFWQWTRITSQPAQAALGLSADDELVGTGNAQSGGFYTQKAGVVRPRRSLLSIPVHTYTTA